MESDKPVFGMAATPTDKLTEAATDNAAEGGANLECATGQDVAEVAVQPTEETAPVHECLTQPAEHTATKKMSHADRHQIFVGFNGECPRYSPGSIIKYVSYFAGWPGGQGQLISDTMWAAASAWNAQNIGVRFQWTTNPAEATFEVIYGGEHPTAAARAFFPKNRGGNQVIVYAASFTPAGLARMQNSFQHELGHIMGLRHEFADTETPPAVLLGVRNRLSIMSYEFARLIQATDVQWARVFYTRPNGSSITDATQSLPIRDYAP